MGSIKGKIQNSKVETKICHEIEQIQISNLVHFENSVDDKMMNIIDELNVNYKVGCIWIRIDSSDK